MPTRLPISAKILLWFFLNLALLAVVLLFLFNAQFHFDLNWLLANVARERVEQMRSIVQGELDNTAPDEWDRVIERFSTVYKVRFTLLDEEGDHLIGPVKELPAEVRAKFAAQDQPPQQRPPSAATSGSSAAPSATPPRPPDPRRWRGRPLRDLVRTTGPTHYWLLIGLRIDNAETGGPMRAVLLADDTSVSMGGLIVDIGPWLKLGLGAIAFSVLFWFPLLHGITRSIGRMTHATKQIAEGRFDVRIPSHRRDELGSLAESINQMASRLDGFVKGQKRFVGDVAHELCAPLARLQMALGIIEQHSTEQQLAYSKTANEKAEQIATLVNALLAFSKASFSAQSVHLRPVNVKEAAEKALAGETAAPGEVVIEISAYLTVSSDPDLLVRAIANLIRNGLRHNDPKAGKITVTATRHGENIEITVTDHGTGVPEEELPKIFDAFYRLDTSRTRETGGVGLGLTIVKTCVESCHGTVTARNRQPHGLEVAITLPADVTGRV